MTDITNPTIRKTYTDVVCEVMDCFTAEQAVTIMSRYSNGPIHPDDDHCPDVAIVVAGVLANVVYCEWPPPGTLGWHLLIGCHALQMVDSHYLSEIEVKAASAAIMNRIKRHGKVSRAVRRAVEKKLPIDGLLAAL